MKGDFFMMNQFENRITGESPFKPDFENYINAHPGRGSLKVQVSAANQSFPVKNVFVEVAVMDGAMRYSLYQDVTDESGIVNEIVLPSRLSAATQDPETASLPEPQYLVSLYHPGFEEITDCPVTVFDRVETILPISLTPVTDDTEG